MAHQHEDVQSRQLSRVLKSPDALAQASLQARHVAVHEAVDAMLEVGLLRLQNEQKLEL
jgi:hypothetical protein